MFFFIWIQTMNNMCAAVCVSRLHMHTDRTAMWAFGYLHWNETNRKAKSRTKRKRKRGGGEAIRKRRQNNSKRYRRKKRKTENKMKKNHASNYDCCVTVCAVAFGCDLINLFGSDLIKIETATLLQDVEYVWVVLHSRFFFI